MTMLRRPFLTLLLLMPLLMLLPRAPLASAGETPAPITAAQFRADVALIRASIARMHPDPGFSTDPNAMQAALTQAADGLPPTLTRDQAWQRLAALNPLLADGHFVIGYADWRGDTRQWLASGGTLFPVEVDLGLDGVLRMRADSPLAPAARIVSVNGVNAEALVSALAGKVHGDTPGFRANLLAQRWWLFYWKTFGAPERYRLVLEQDGRQRTLELPGSRELPLVMRKQAQSRFRLAIQPDGVAVLTVDTFSQSDVTAFLDFTRQAFARIRAEGVTTLVIDVSENGGGDDVMWLDGLMPYLATQPYRTGSTYRAMTRLDAGKPGKLIDGEIATWRQPQMDNPLRFGGKVQVRIGPGTYSSAVLFANVMRDFRFATLIGSGGWARQAQSGGVRDVTLPHTGLVISLPRFILDPPAGRAPGALLEAGDSDPAPGNTYAACPWARLVPGPGPGELSTRPER